MCENSTNLLEGIKTFATFAVTITKVLTNKRIAYGVKSDRRFREGCDSGTIT